MQDTLTNMNYLLKKFSQPNRERVTVETFFRAYASAMMIMLGRLNCFDTREEFEIWKRLFDDIFELYRKEVYENLQKMTRTFDENGI